MTTGVVLVRHVANELVHGAQKEWRGLLPLNEDGGEAGLGQIRVAVEFGVSTGDIRLPEVFCVVVGLDKTYKADAVPGPNGMNAASLHVSWTGYFGDPVSYLLSRFQVSTDRSQGIAPVRDFEHSKVFE